MNTTFFSQKKYFCILLSLFALSTTFVTQHISAASKKPATPETIAWIDNVPVVTTTDVKKHKDQLQAENPQLAQMFTMIPQEEIDRQIAEALLQQNIIDIYIQKSGISSTSDYKEDLATAQKMAAAVVNNTYFTDSVSSTLNISDKELREFYDKNKDTFPGVIKERGGIQAVGISFDDEKKAQVFTKSLGSKDLKTEGKKQKLNVVEFGLVTETKQAQAIDANIKSELFKIKKFPQVIQAEDKDGKVWVVQALSKKETTYESFDKVKGQMKERALQYKVADSVSSKLTKLKEDYKVKINQDYFGSEEPLNISHEEMDAMMEAMEGMEGLEDLGLEDLEEEPADMEEE